MANQTSNVLGKVSKAHLQYKLNRKRIRARQRKQLEQENLPDLVNLGREIEEARQHGYRVAEIMVALGIKNRNFLYDAWNAYRATVVVPDEDEPVTPDNGASLDYIVKVDKLSSTTVLVTFTEGFNDPEEFTLTVNQQGQIVDMPVSWLDNPTRERRAAAQSAIAEVLELFAE